MKYFLRSEQSHQRRLPQSERQTEKGQKHEAFDYGRMMFGQRGAALAQRMDRKR
jgi:hypothetical protein